MGDWGGEPAHPPLSARPCCIQTVRHGGDEKRSKFTLALFSVAKWELVDSLVFDMNSAVMQGLFFFLLLFFFFF